MADITLKLIWYRLSQTYSKMATAASTWYTDLDFDSYVLDLLLLAWCAGAAIVVVSVNSIKNALGPPTKQPAVERPRDYAQTGDGAFASVSTRGQQGETCQWFNTVVNWLYLHYYHHPVYLDEWIKSLNEQLTKLGGPVQNRFESIQPGSLPPKISNINCTGTQDSDITMLVKIESQDLLLSVFASQQCSEGMRLTNCLAHVLKLNGTLRVKAFLDRKDVKVRISFESRPEVKVEVKPTNPYQDPATLADLDVVEQNVRNALGLAATTITITKLLMPGDLTTLPGHVREEDAQPSKSGEVRVRASDAGWGMSARDIALLNQRFTAQNLQNQMAQLASSIQQPSQSQVAPVVQQVPPQSRPQPVHQHVSVQKSPEAIQSISVQPVRQQQLAQQSSQPLSQSVQPPPPQAQQRSLDAAAKTNESLFEPISPSQYQSAFSSPPAGAPLKPPRMVGDKRLYVKVIKGNSLTLPEKGTVNAVCYISTDEPVQSYTSTMVRNTANPFWDEHFLFDITHDTRELRFEVYDKSANDGGEEYIGESTIYIEDLKKTPSSRQILRLQSQPGSFDYSTGTITAEFLFMEPAEADSLLNSMTPNVSQLSPRRRIEVSQMVTPGGTRVTTTTTTTQKPQYGRMEAGYNTAPNYVEKRVPELDASYSSERLSPNPGDTSAGQYLGRQIPTIESSPTEDSPDSALSSQTSPERQAGRGLTPETEKKKTSFWKRFGRKKRSYSADRSSSSAREGAYLQPPQPQYGSQSKDDLELVRPQEPGSPNLKKSRSLGGSLKKLFRRGRKSRSRARDGDTSRESSMSRGSGRNPASRDGSLNRQSAQNRASSVS